jgi:hypothetical protein
METPYQRMPKEVMAGSQAHSVSNATDKRSLFFKIKAGGS